jgi:hypothetical protein
MDAFKLLTGPNKKSYQMIPVSSRFTKHLLVFILNFD